MSIATVTGVSSANTVLQVVGDTEQCPPTASEGFPLLVRSIGAAVLLLIIAAVIWGISNYIVHRPQYTVYGFQIRNALISFALLAAGIALIFLTFIVLFYPSNCYSLALLAT